MRHETREPIAFAKLNALWEQSKQNADAPKNSDDKLVDPPTVG
jgi:hypothetical protein